MGLMDKLKKHKDTAGDLARKHGDTIDKGIDKAVAQANKATGNKHADKIDKGAAAARNGVDKLSGENRPPRDSGPESPR